MRSSARMARRVNGNSPVVELATTTGSTIPVLDALLARANFRASAKLVAKSCALSARRVDVRLQPRQHASLLLFTFHPHLPPMSRLLLQDVRKSFGATAALRGVSLGVARATCMRSSARMARRANGN